MKIKTIFTVLVLFLAFNSIKVFAYSDQTQECIDRINGHILKDFSNYEISDEMNASIQKDIANFCLTTTPSMVSTVDNYSEFSELGQLYWNCLEQFAGMKILYENVLSKINDQIENNQTYITLGNKELISYLENNITETRNSYRDIFSQDSYFDKSTSAVSKIFALINDGRIEFVDFTGIILTKIEDNYTCDLSICTLNSSIIDNPPSDITDLSGILKKYNSISLNWTNATDDNGVEKYIVTYDDEPIVFSDYNNIKKLPNIKYTTTNKLFIANLDDNKTYYFYVAAIDTVGNLSTHWSNLYTFTFSDEEDDDENTFSDFKEVNVDINETPFSDVSESYKNHEAILALYNQKVIGGYDDGTFKPNKTVNRAELLKILIGAKEIVIPVNEYNYCFTDVKNEWFAPYVCYAKEQGWIQGYEDGTFKPSQIVNKVESLKMLLEVYGVETPDTSQNNTSYTDIDTSAWYWKYISKAYELDIIEDSGIYLAPNNGMRRGSFCESLYRLTN